MLDPLLRTQAVHNRSVIAGAVQPAQLKNADPHARLAVGTRREDPERLHPVQRKPLRCQRTAKYRQQRQPRRPGQRRCACVRVRTILAYISFGLRLGSVLRSG